MIPPLIVWLVLIAGAALAARYFGRRLSDLRDHVAELPFDDEHDPAHGAGREPGPGA